MNVCYINHKLMGEIQHQQLFIILSTVKYIRGSVDSAKTIASPIVSVLWATLTQQFNETVMKVPN